MTELIKINGIHLNTEVRGSGKPLLLIHGIGGNHKQLDVIANPLSEIYRTIHSTFAGMEQAASQANIRYRTTYRMFWPLWIITILKTPILGVSMGSYVAQGVAIASPNARFIEMKFSGHAPMYEKPELYLTYVKDFLSSR